MAESPVSSNYASDSQTSRARIHMLAIQGSLLLAEVVALIWLVDRMASSEWVEAVCLATGASQVDLVGHSLGGLIARYLTEMGDGGRVRRVVTLGAPYFATRIPPRELAIFGAYDFFVVPPHPVYGPHGRIVLVPDCGHWGLLYHPMVLEEVARFLSFPLGIVSLPTAPLALEAC